MKNIFSRQHNKENTSKITLVHNQKWCHRKNERKGFQDAIRLLAIARVTLEGESVYLLSKKYKSIYIYNIRIKGNRSKAI